MYTTSTRLVFNFEEPFHGRVEFPDGVLLSDFRRLFGRQSRVFRRLRFFRIGQPRRQRRIQGRPCRGRRLCGARRRRRALRHHAIARRERAQRQPAERRAALVRVALVRVELAVVVPSALLAAQTVEAQHLGALLGALHREHVTLAQP